MKHGAKAEFVRKHPGSTPAEVAALAAKAGLKMTAGYVSSVRWKDQNGQGVAPSKKRKTSSKPAPKGKPSGSGVSELRAAILKHGLSATAAVVKELGG